MTTTSVVLPHLFSVGHAPAEMQFEKQVVPSNYSERRPKSLLLWQGEKVADRPDEGERRWSWPFRIRCVWAQESLFSIAPFHFRQTRGNIVA